MKKHMTELIHEMMNNDSCKQMMMDSVMRSMQSHPTVMKFMKGMCDMDNMKK